MRRIFWNDSELMLACSSKMPADQLRVGKAPAPLTKSTSTGVPSSWAHRLSSVSTNSEWMRCMSLRNALASPTATEPVPRTAIALRFLSPMRAPWPPRPALWYWSVERQAQGILFSPAGPMESVLASGSKSSRMACSISDVFMPQYLGLAGRNSTTSSLMQTTVGSAALPLMMTMS